MPKGKKIAYTRADSASYQADVINEFEADGVFWTITADQDEAVKAILGDIAETEWKEPRPARLSADRDADMSLPKPCIR